MVPLSRTRAEQVKAIREWAFKRATRASKPVVKPPEPKEQV